MSKEVERIEVLKNELIMISEQYTKSVEDGDMVFANGLYSRFKVVKNLLDVNGYEVDYDDDGNPVIKEKED